MLRVLLTTWSALVSVLQVLRRVTGIIAMSLAPSSAHDSGSGSSSSRSGEDVVCTAHFDFDLITTSSSVKDRTNPDANDLAVVADIAHGLPQ